MLTGFEIPFTPGPGLEDVKDDCVQLLDDGSDVWQHERCGPVLLIGDIGADSAVGRGGVEFCMGGHDSGASSTCRAAIF